MAFTLIIEQSVHTVLLDLGQGGLVDTRCTVVGAQIGQSYNY
jgi:hypothetical protein